MPPASQVTLSQSVFFVRDAGSAGIARQAVALEFRALSDSPNGSARSSSLGAHRARSSFVIGQRNSNPGSEPPSVLENLRSNVTVATVR